MGSDRPSSAAVLLRGASYKRAAVLGGKKKAQGRLSSCWIGLEWMHSAFDMQQGSIQSCPAAVTMLYADLCHVSSAKESSAQSRCQPGTRTPCLGLAFGWCDGVCSSH